MSALDYLTTTTAAWGGYGGRYLQRWSEAIVRTDPRPGAVVIVIAGDDPSDLEAGELALDRLTTAGIDTRLVLVDYPASHPVARNRAIWEASSEWVQFLDVDDEVLRDAYAQTHDVIAAGDADVVQWGWLRRGQALRSLPLGQLYSPRDGEEILHRAPRAPSSSPFRRQLWLQRPYRVDMRGSWDSALWLGFGHLGARFRPTPRHAFAYHLHDDSEYQARPPELTSAIQSRLRLIAEHWAPDVEVLIPWRDDPARRPLLEWVKARLAAHHPGWRLTLVDAAGPFSRGRSINAGAQASDAHVLLPFDADIYFDDPELLLRTTAAASAFPWVVPHGSVYRLSEAATSPLLARDPREAPLHQRTTNGRSWGAWRRPETIATPYRGTPGGGVFAMTRRNFSELGGFHPAFVGWGHEDGALGLAADALLGGHLRLEAPLLHLYHPPAPKRSHPWAEANLCLYRHHQAAAGEARGDIRARVESMREACPVCGERCGHLAELEDQIDTTRSERTATTMAEHRSKTRVYGTLNGKRVLRYAVGDPIPREEAERQGLIKPKTTKASSTTKAKPKTTTKTSSSSSSSKASPASKAAQAKLAAAKSSSNDGGEK